jgi:hypothetical protein
MGKTHRENALHCLLAAHRVRDPALRYALLNLAINYRTLADYADRRNESGTARRGDKEDA